MRRRGTMFQMIMGMVMLVLGMQVAQEKARNAKQAYNALLPQVQQLRRSRGVK